MKIKFLGTNGWYSSKTGLTPCVFIDAKEGYFILDAGEGIQHIDRHIVDEKKPIYLFISHFHLDHIHGLHLFPRFKFKQGLTIIGKCGTEKMCRQILNDPYSIKLEKVPMKISIREVDEGQSDWPVPMECALLPHPDPSMGYRLTLEEKFIVYCTDTGAHPNITRLASGADAYISECAHLTGEDDPGWPHMNPEGAAKCAVTAKAKKLFLMHFDAWRYQSIEQRHNAQRVAREIFPNTFATEDQMEFEV